MADQQAIAYLYTSPGTTNRRITVLDFKLEMCPFAHSIAKIVIQGTDDTTAQWDTGAPIIVRYGRQPNAMTNFYGYMLFPEPNWKQTLKNQQANRRMTIWAIGTSWPFKDGLSQPFLNMTAPQIAQAIAGTHFLSVNAPTSSSDYVWPMKTAINGQSEWEFLVELAKASGRTCHVNGTQLDFYDPSTTLVQPDPVVPTFYEKDSGKGMTVLDFTPDNNEVSADPGRRKRTRIFQSLDRNGNPIFLTDDGTNVSHRFGSRYRAPLFTEYVSSIVAHSPQDAKALLPALTTDNRFYIRAQAILSGNVQVTQETPIVIEGVGIRDSGLWQVISVTHHVGWQWYSMECELGRDSDFDNGIRPLNPPGVARTFMTSYGSVPITTPPTILNNNVWRAAFSVPV